MYGSAATSSASILAAARVGFCPQLSCPPARSMRAASNQLLPLQVRAFALTWVSYASVYFTRKNLAVVKSRLHEDLGITTKQLGAIDFSYLVVYAIGQFLSGVLGDRIGPRRLLALGMLGSAG